MQRKSESHMRGVVMKTVITQAMTVAAEALPRTIRRIVGGALIVTDDAKAVDQARLARRSGGPVVVWNPEALVGPASNCSWDLLGGIGDAPDADRIAQHLLSPVLDNRLASFFVPEAGLLVANMLLAAARRGGAFTDILDWVWKEDAAVAGELLRSHGEFEAYRDVADFLAQDDITRGSVWETTQMALKPLNYSSVLASLTRPDVRTGRLPGPFSTLHAPVTGLAEPATVYVLRSRNSEYSGLTSALVAELLRTASAHPAPTTVLEINNYGPQEGF